MTVRKFWLGDVGPLLYDDAKNVLDPDGTYSSDYQIMLRGGGSIIADEITGLVISSVAVTDIDDPSPELNALNSSSVGALIFCYQVAAGVPDEFTMYLWDTNYGSEDPPYIVDGSSGGGWVAVSGKYQKTLTYYEESWDDVAIDISNVRLPAANAPTWTSYKSSEVLAFGSSSNNTIHFTAQLPHKYAQGTDIEFHIHYALATSGAGAGAENVKWTLTYSWANIDGTIAAASTTSVTIDVQNLVADTHYLGEIIASITGTGKSISSILICSLTRDVSVANDYASSIYLLSADFHVQMNTIGSSTATAK